MVDGPWWRMQTGTFLTIHKMGCAQLRTSNLKPRTPIFPAVTSSFTTLNLNLETLNLYLNNHPRCNSLIRSLVHQYHAACDSVFAIAVKRQRLGCSQLNTCNV